MDFIYLIISATWIQVCHCWNPDTSVKIPIFDVLATVQGPLWSSGRTNPVKLLAPDSAVRLDLRIIERQVRLVGGTSAARDQG
jgi:hypothetical protein